YARRGDATPAGARTPGRSGTVPSRVASAANVPVAAVGVRHALRGWGRRGGRARRGRSRGGRRDRTHGDAVPDTDPEPGVLASPIRFPGETLASQRDHRSTLGTAHGTRSMRV